MSCACDQPPVAGPRTIPAGLSLMPRQLGSFAERRRALLGAASAQPALVRWRSRAPEELGVLLLEWWAYVLDVTGFYDEAIAHEAYMRTARREQSLRRLVELLGYVPKPAVGAAVALAALADGPDPVLVPAGTAFRSAAVPGAGPPQVFELGADTTIAPQFNAWSLAPVRPSAFADAPGITLLLERRGMTLAPGDIVLARRQAHARVLAVQAVGTRAENDGATYATATFDRDPGIPAGTPRDAVQLLVPTSTAGLWKLPVAGTDGPALDLGGAKTKLVLDGLHRRLNAGDTVVISKDADRRWFRLDAVTETQRTVTGPLTSTVKDTSGTVTGSLVSPPVTTAATVLTLDASINSTARKGAASDPDWTANDASALVVQAGLVRAATPALPVQLGHTDEDELVIDGPVEVPAGVDAPGHFLLAPSEGAGADITGVLQPEERRIVADAGATWPPLRTPLTAHANVLAATRGETVRDERLGAGDATVHHQRFTLAKQPLTYVPAPGTELGARSTLEVRVSGRRWQEVPSFYGYGEHDEIYITRPGEAGATDVIFGGLGRGAQLPTGGAITASYRFGAGAQLPPPRSITQLAKPLAGLAQVRDPVGSYGGADAEGTEALRGSAPASALLLGRAVSVADMEAVAAGVPGVRAAKAEWRWSGTRQRPLVHIAYIGAAELDRGLVRTVKALTDPITPVEAVVADPEPHALAVDVAVDPALVSADVAEAVRAALHDGETAALAPARLGVGAPLLRSVLFATVLAVPGVVAVQSAQVDGAGFEDFALVPADGCWLDFVDAGSVTASGTEAS